MAWQGGLFEGHSLELLGQWAVGSGSETPWPEKTCHSCRAMTPWLGHGALISKQLSRGSQKQRPSGTSQTVAWPRPVAWTVRWAVRA